VIAIKISVSATARGEASALQGDPIASLIYKIVYNQKDNSYLSEFRG
jgi:hypothetical protein